jgi:ABC-type glycerol-3-phosphate transport system substrate-binding protein
MTNAENNTAWSMATGYTPLRKSGVSSDVFQAYLDANPNANPAIDQIPYTRARPNIAAYGDISRVIGNAIEAALVGQQDPATVLASAIEEANEVLADWAERLQQ